MRTKKLLALTLTLTMLISMVGISNIMALAAEDGLIVHYKFSGNTTDSSGNGFNGTLNGTGYEYVDDPFFEKALDLKGNTAYVKLPGNSLESTRTTSISVSAWLLSGAFGDWQRMFDFGKTSATGYFFYAPHNATPVAKITETSNGSEQGISNGRRWGLDNKWHHAVVVLDYSTQTMSLYKDGVLDRSASGVTITMGDILSATASDNNLYIGKAQYNDPYLNAKIADFRVYNKALSAADVTSLYSDVMTAENMSKADVETLTIEGDLNNVIGNLTLPTTGVPYGSAITWSSSNPSVVSTTGVVTRPGVSESDATVVLTATLPGSVQKTFTVTVKRNLTEAQSVQEDKDALDLGDTSNVTYDLTLPTKGAQGSTITWSSSDSSTVSSTGKVTTPESGSKTVTLTATITKGSITDTKEFTVTVCALRKVGDGVNISLAPQAEVTASYTASPSIASTVNDGELAGSSAASCWETWAAGSNPVTIYYEWPDTVTPSSLEVCWWYDQTDPAVGGVQLPTACTVQYWTGSTWVNVTNMADANGLPVNTVGLKGNGTFGNSTTFNGVTFDPVETTRLRLTITQNRTLASTTGVGISEWSVYSNDSTSIAFGGVSFVEPQWTTKDLTLPSVSTGGYSLTWSSSDTDVISNDGKLTRDDKEHTVTMTATAKKDDVVLTKEYVFTVLPEGESPRTIDVDLDNLGIEISPTLYGAFFEDIDHALDGGINANLVDNGSFQQYNWPTALPSSVSNRGPNDDRYSTSATTIYSWRSVTKGSAAGTATIVGTSPMNTNNTYNVEINITTAGTGTTRGYGIAANGYSTSTATNTTTASMPINAGVSYDLEMYLRGQYSGDVLVFLESSSGTLNSNILTFNTDSNDWTKVAGSLTALRTEDNRLAIIGNEVGKFYLDYVTLLPEASTLWHGGAAGGLRNDLVSAVEDLNPKFLRFPGGCASEGKSEDRLYRWKDTVGSKEERKQIPNYWGYWSSNEIGYYEYLCLAEELGAAALPVIGLGLSCPFWKGSNYYEAPIGTAEELQAYKDLYVQDALDLIEFCNGDVNTEWGALRAEMGHPEPFNLEYIGIGNENWGTAFWQRFDIVYTAVREAYPDIEIISTSGPYSSGSDFNYNYSQIDSKYADTIVDEHYYQDSQWFLDNVNRYNPNSVRGGQGNTYDRSKETRVFVGEYADAGNANNYRSALYEAAFTTALEKNSDMVVMASYAPLFCRKVTPTNWGANLIWFDNRGLWRSNNYYYQMLFANNKGDRAAGYDMHTYSNTDDPALYISPTVDTENGDAYVKIVNTDAMDKEIRVNLNGSNDQYKAVLEYISTDDLQSRNQNASTYTEAVTPQSVDLGEVSGYVTIDVPIYSVCVLRLEKVESSGGYSINAEQKGDDKAVDVTIENSDEDPVNAIVILAWYDENGILTERKSKSVSVNKSNSYTASLMLDGEYGKGTLKAFVWDSGTYIPLCSAFEYRYTE